MLSNSVVNDVDILGNGPLLVAVGAVASADAAVPEPTDVVPIKYIGYVVAFGLAWAGDALLNNDPVVPPRPKPREIPKVDPAVVVAAAIAAEIAAKKAKCETLHAAYKLASKRFSKNPCKDAKCCKDIAVAVGRLSAEVGGRWAYINAGCDKIEWDNTKHPNDPAARRKAHEGQLAGKIGAFKKCWEKALELGCFGEVFAGRKR
jgi:hypothetical protein